MFKLQKQGSTNKVKPKLEFQFSDFIALQVPKGWDKLYVSIVSVATGKSVVKSAKTSVRNSTCRWPDTFSQSIDNADFAPSSSPAFLFKFVVAMGSSRSGVLGEVNLDLAHYLTSRNPVPLSLPLDKCNYATSLQFRVQCLTPKSRYRTSQHKETIVDVENGNSDQDNMDTKSNASDGAYSRSVGSTSSSHLESATSISQALLSRDPSLSASDSRHSLDSIEVSSGKDISSENNHLGAVSIGRQDSIESYNSGQSASFCAVNDGIQLISNSKGHETLSAYGHQREEQNSSSFVSPPFYNDGSSKDLLEAAEVTIGELRAEARMWERNSKKLTVDLNSLKNEVSEQSRSHRTLSMELSASHQECDGLKQEIENLKRLLEESENKQDAGEDLRIQTKNMTELKRQMDEEIVILKTSNADLSKQLQKTQESNIELLSILQELEGIIETQKLEIDSLSFQKSKLVDNEHHCPSNDVEFFEPNLGSSEIAQPIQVSDDQFSMGVDNIKLQLQQLQEKQEELESAIRLLEKTVEEKDNEIEKERELRVQALSDVESKWSLKVAAKEEEIVNLEAKLAKADSVCHTKEAEIGSGGETLSVKEIELLSRKVEDLEKECNELTEENLELLVKLKEPKKDLSSTNALASSSYCGSDSNCSSTCEAELRNLRIHLHTLQRERRTEEALVEEVVNSAQPQVSNADLENKCCELEIQLQISTEKAVSLEDELQKFHVRVRDQETKIYDLQQQLKHYEAKTGDLDSVVITGTKENVREEQESIQEHGTLKKCENLSSSQGLEESDTVINSDVKTLDLRASDIDVLNSDDLRKTEELEALHEKMLTLENQIVTVRNENLNLKDNVESLEKEKVISSETIEELNKEIMILTSSVESHVSAKKVLERLSSELERGKQDVEQQLSDLENENMQLSERISALEAQLRYLTNEKETCHLVLRHSEVQSAKLRNEVRRLESDMEAQRVDMKGKLQDMKSRWLEAQEECEYLNKANPKLQSTTESLIEECDSLQILNGDLKKQNRDLHMHCTVLESELKECQGKFLECLQKIEALEAEYCTMLEEVSLKEKSLKSELDSVVVEDKEHKEKLMQENISLNDMYSRKVVEVENLQRELVHLIDQISVAHDEKENSQILLELSVLRSDKAKLEVALQELQGKLYLCQSNLSTVASESEVKMQVLMRELIASRKNEEFLIGELDKLSVLLESIKSKNEKHKSSISELEINLKDSEYQRRQLAKEISTLREQIQRATLLQEELLALKTSLSETKFEYERVKTSLDLLRADHEELMSEKDSLVRNVSAMEKSLLELGDCQLIKIALQEKVLRLEGDLAAKEALCSQDAEIKFELSRIRRANNELQRKIKHLEQNQEGYLNRIQVLEEQLKQKIQTMPDLMKSLGHPSVADAGLPLVPFTRDENQLIGISGYHNPDYLLKIQSLENELAEALEANDMYKDQLRRFLSEEQKNSSVTSEGDKRSDIKVHADILSLEIELNHLREKYFQMSLKYGEVEAQREELVLKLKSTNNKKSWFF